LGKVKALRPCQSGRVHLPVGKGCHWWGCQGPGQKSAFLLLVRFPDLADSLLACPPLSGAVVSNLLPCPGKEMGIQKNITILLWDPHILLVRLSWPFAYLDISVWVRVHFDQTILLNCFKRREVGRRTPLCLKVIIKNLLPRN